jgi:hypothetical protein
MDNATIIQEFCRQTAQRCEINFLTDTAKIGKQKFKSIEAAAAYALNALDGLRRV